MLQPREADIPALFLVLVVLPLVTYILLGKWNEASKKKARISELAKLASEEAFKTDVMAVTDVVPVVPSQNILLHVCARCFGPATTRCSRCKSVRYCSGKCQIIHWRQGHKQDCQEWKDDSSNTFCNPTSMSESVNLASSGVHLKSEFPPNNLKEFMHNIEQSNVENAAKVVRRDVHNIKRDLSSCEDNITSYNPTSSPYICVAELPSSNETPKRYKLANNNSSTSDSTSVKQNHSSQAHGNGSRSSRNAINETNKVRVKDRSTLESHTSGDVDPLCLRKNVSDGCGTETNLHPEKFDFLAPGFSTSEALDSSPLVEKTTGNGGTRFRKPPYTIEHSSTTKKVVTKPGREHMHTGNGQYMTYCAGVPVPNVNGNANFKSSDKKLADARSSQKPPKHSSGVNSGDCVKKNKVLFPYEDLVKFYRCEIKDVHPRGLMNCGNSCYANAVLQCLTCTKPLLVYLLRRIHSRSCYVRDWCLMCELELHVSMLREGRGPLSPSKVLSNMRSIGCRMGGGNQEDAHEFLRLLVMSMQSVCLEGVGGEKEIDSRLQETTLIQQLFGGSIRSRVKCLRCELESERYENIMDLTLEIHGWVESLEDALTQFTAPEDLDGDNMYRCGRCSSYVKARKQLSVHEAPNILTIVLKRFQSGKYGKINKCVTFPDMLDMIPFMTGTSDIPPLYLLYAVVVHLDTLNASFSGHYVSYVKDLQGTWFRIDDTEVQAVPVGQVMSEGAYMLFYSRSFPRPPRIYSSKASAKQTPDAAKHSISKPPRSSRHESPKPNGVLFALPNGGAQWRAETRAYAEDEKAGTSICKNSSVSGMAQKHANVGGSASMDFSDAASSDWSLFTSSDESSFTTESTSDSFSTVDCNDAGSLDPISSLFSPVYIPEYSQKNSILCREFSCSGAKTRFFLEEKGYVVDSSSSLARPLGYVHKGKSVEGSKTREQSQS